MTDVVIIQKRDWEEAISQGLELREVKDNSQWALGEWAESGCQKFGGTSLKKLATDISLPYNTLREYRRIHLRVPPEIRIPHLSYRHHQKAADTDNPKEWLEKASDGGWTSEMLELKIAESKGKIKVEELRPGADKCDECDKWKVVGVEEKELCTCHCYKYRIKPRIGT